MAEDPDFTESLRELYGDPLPPLMIEKLMGDASTRRYYRARVEGTAKPSSSIIMQLPEDAFASDEGGGTVATDRLPFLEVGDLLRDARIPVPNVYVEHLAAGQIVLEDLGSTTFEGHLRSIQGDAWHDSYSRAVDLLGQMHERCAHLPSSSIVGRREFDRALLAWELDHFREWGLEALFGPNEDADADTFHAAVEDLVDRLVDLPTGFVHRDYQSRNLMVDEQGNLTIIDFQDALIGPRVYDLVALLCDSYVSLPESLQDAMIARYAAARRHPVEEIRREFWLVAVHRKLKDAGRFVFIDRQRKNPSFLRWYPQSLVYVGRALSHLPELEPFEALLHRRIPGFPHDVENPTPAME